MKKIVEKAIQGENLTKKEFRVLSLLLELIGIILGDGNIRYYSFRIDLNRIDESDYVIYVSKLLFRVFNKNPRKRLRKGLDGKSVGKGIRLIINGIEIIHFFLELGLKIGHKIKNNSDVPNWILKNKQLIPFTLRGLFDTDGNIDIHKEWSSLTLRFVSGSNILMNNFKQMFKSLGIKTSNIRKIKIKSKKYNKLYDAWVISIGSKEDVKKFIKIVKPKKFFYRKKLIAMRLIVIEDSEKMKIVMKEQKKNFPNKEKINKYSKEYEDFLQKLFIDNNWELTEDVVERVINNTLELKSHPYNINLAENIKDLFEKTGTIEKVIKILNLGDNTVKTHIKKLLNENHYIEIFNKKKPNPLEIEGNTFFEKWNKNNSRLIINESKTAFNQFNSKLRIKIALYIHCILNNSKEDKIFSDDEIINQIKVLIDQSPFLGRLSYLINDRAQKHIVRNYLKKIINIIRIYMNNPMIAPYTIAKKTDIKRDTIQDIIDEIKKNYN